MFVGFRQQCYIVCSLWWPWRSVVLTAKNQCNIPHSNNQINQYCNSYRGNHIKSWWVLYPGGIGIWKCCGFLWRKTGEPREKQLEARTNSKLNPPMAPGPELNPGHITEHFHHCAVTTHCFLTRQNWILFLVNNNSTADSHLIWVKLSLKQLLSGDAGM